MASLWIWLLSTLVGQHLCFVESAVSPCRSGYECLNETVQDNNGEITCGGYMSCAHASLNGSSYTTCSGSRSCYSSTILNNDDNRLQLRCHGLKSCSNMDCYSEMQANQIECNGDESCANANLRIISSIKCDGFNGCANSHIDASSGTTHQFRGYMACQNCILTNNNISTVTYQFYAPFSGYNSSIYCSQGTECDIECSGNGCNDLNLICETGNDTCTFNINCDESAEWSSHCDTGLLLSTFMHEMPMPRPLLSNHDINENECHDSTTSYLKFQEAKGFNISNSESVICCLGIASCSFAVAISTHLENGTIRCDGYQSCYQSNKIIAGTGGDIGLTGYDSAGTGNLIEARNEYDVYCTAPWSCRNQTIINANNVYCAAYRACLKLSLIENVTNVYIYGELAAARSQKIENISENVYCQGRKACTKCHFRWVAGDVYGSGMQTLMYSTFNHVTDSVMGFGYQTLAYSNISNVTNVKCDGPSSCMESRIESINYVYANGSNALCGSKMISGSTNDDSLELNVAIDGTYNEDCNNFTLVCSNTDTCRIDCQSSTACQYFNVYCQGMCHIKCNEEENIQCPQTYGNASTNIVLPTKSPTMSPSLAPVAVPTVSPTQAPTNAPTITPSMNPTTAPTRFPTNYKNYTVKISVNFDIVWTRLNESYNAQMFINFLTEFESSWYTQIKNVFESNYASSQFLDFQEFDIIFTNIIGTGIGLTVENKINVANYSSMVSGSSGDLQSRKLLDNDIDSSDYWEGSIVLSCSIYCLSDVVGAIRTISEDDEFENKTQSHLWKLVLSNADSSTMNIENAIFFSVDMTTWTKIDLSTSSDDGGSSSISEIDSVYFILAGLTVILIIVTFLENLHFKGLFVIRDWGCKLGDGTQISKLWIFGLQIWDFISDINFAAQMITLSIADNGDNLVIFALAILSPLFIILPYVANIRAAMTVYDKVANMNQIAKLYFDTKFVFFCTLVLLSGGVHATIQLMASRLFGMAIFDCGLSKQELILFKKIHLTHSVLFENAPQLILQIIYVIEIGTILDDTVLFAAVASFFSGMIAIFSYYFSTKIEFNQVTINLDVKFETETMKQDVYNCNKYMGYRNKLGRKISRALGVVNSKIEVFSIVNHANGCMVYIGYAMDDLTDANEILPSSKLGASLNSRSASVSLSSNTTRDHNIHMHMHDHDGYGIDDIDDSKRHSTRIHTARARTTMSVETETSVMTKFIGACEKASLIPDAICQTWKLNNVPYVNVVNENSNNNDNNNDKNNNNDNTTTNNNYDNGIGLTAISAIPPSKSNQFWKARSQELEKELNILKSENEKLNEKCNNFYNPLLELDHNPYQDIDIPKMIN